MRVISFLASAGCGKSTLAHGLIYELKRRRMPVEFLEEPAKLRALEKDLEYFEKQENILNDYFNELCRRAKCGVEILVTDASILNSAIYSDNDAVRLAAFERFEMFPTITVYVERDVPYETFGRYHSQEEAQKLDEKFKQLADMLEIGTHPVIRCSSTESSWNLSLKVRDALASGYL